MRKLDLDVIVLFVFSLIVCYESFRLTLGSASKPGPGLFPLLLGVTLGVLSLMFLFAKGFKQDKKTTVLPPSDFFVIDGGTTEFKKGTEVLGRRRGTKLGVQGEISDAYANGDWPRGSLKPLPVVDCTLYARKVFSKG